MCRADIRVVWTCTATRSSQGPSLPSRFISRVLGRDPGPAGPTPPGDAGPPSTPAEAEAWLRRLLGDPAAPAARRLAALHLLAAPAPRLPRHPDQFAGVPHRGSDRGLATDVTVFSPSQAEAYLSCPRLYAFRRRLHVDSADSTHLDFGHLVHRVLERVEAAAAASGEPHGSEAAALDTLDDLFDAAVFGGGARAASWHRRAARMLAHLYRNWPSRGRAALVEADVEAEVDGVRWRGRIDRIEVEDQADGTRLIRIVDYKTGSSLPGVDEVSRSVQLGFYTLAVAADPRLGSLGEVAAAEMWFPAADQKKVAVRRLDPGRLDEVKEAMRRAVEGIRSEDWAPQPGPACRRCPVRTVCPEWPEGRESFRG
jgi:putative RecB family exonuclease